MSGPARVIGFPVGRSTLVYNTALATKDTVAEYLFNKCRQLINVLLEGRYNTGETSNQEI
jgi:hypothetical protein